MMKALTEDEIRQFITKNEWATGLKVEDGECPVYYNDKSAQVWEFEFPKTPMELPYVARTISMLGLDREDLFNGALLWITLSGIGSPQLEKTGWKIVEKMRAGFGELRPLSAAPGHWFRSDEFTDLTAFLLPCFIFGWNAFLLPSGEDFFVHISHDEFWVVVARTREACERLDKELEALSPHPAHDRCKARFCRG